MVTTKLNLSMTEPQVRQIYAKQGDTGRVLDITLDQTPEDGTLRILRPDGTEVTSEAVTGGEVSESGETVTFDSLTEADVTELTVGIEPVQDLNGYDAPWVGGAGKNKLDIEGRTVSTSGASEATIFAESCSIVKNGATLTATSTGAWSKAQLGINGLTEGETYTLSALFNNPNAASIGLAYYEGAWKGSKTSTSTNTRLDITFTYSSAITKVALLVNNRSTSNGEVVTVSEIQLEVGSSATAYSPYSNICPITGHDEVTVTRTGKNLVNVNSSGITGAYIDMNGEIHTSKAWSVSDFVPVMSGENYILSGLTSHPNTGNDNFILYDGNRNKVGNITKSALTSFAIPSGVSYVKFSWKNTEKDTVMFELGSTATAYEPYQGSTYTTSLGQTVYGGTLDMVSGVLTVDSRYLTVNDFTFMSLGTSAGGLYWANVPQTYPAGVNDNSDTNVCSHAPYTTSGDVGWGSTTPIYTVNSSGYPARIYVDSTTYADFQAKYATLQAVYKLAEPVEYQLTAQQVKTLVGTNNVWASSGDIVSIKFTYGGLFAELPSDATSIVGKCYCDVEQNGVSSMPFTLNVKKNERES